MNWKNTVISKTFPDWICKVCPYPSVRTVISSRINGIRRRHEKLFLTNKSQTTLRVFFLKNTANKNKSI